MASLLVACGGGGGGGSSESGIGGASRETALSLTTANAVDAAGNALGYGESVLMLAQVASDWLDALAASGSRSLTLVCSAFGSSRQMVLIDRDNNGVPSAGDRVDVTLTNCLVPVLDDTFSGTLSMELSTPAATGMRWNGSIGFGSTFGVTEGSSSLNLVGGLRFQTLSDSLGQSVRALSADTPLTLRFSEAGRTLQDVLTLIDASKQVRRDMARATTQFTLRAASDTLGGALTVSTVTPFNAWFDTYPDEGVIQVAGNGNSQLRLTAQGSNSSSLSLSVNGASAANLAAAELVSGYLWSGTGLASTPASTGKAYDIRVAGAAPFKILSAPSSTALSPTAPLVWQFSRPLTTPSLSRISFNRGNNVVSAWGPTTIGASVTVQGALLTVTPDSPLEPGVTYGLYSEGFPTSTLVTTAADGSAGTASVEFYYTTRQTVTMTASATATRRFMSWPLLYGAADSMALTATATPASGVSISAVQWRQVSGPPVVFDPATSLATTLRPGTSAGNSPGEAVLEVQTTASNGEINRAQVRVFVARDAAAATLYGSRVVGSSQAEMLNLVRSDTTDDREFSIKLFPGADMLDWLQSYGPRVWIAPPTGQSWSSGLNFGVASAVSSTAGTALQTLFSGYQPALGCTGVSGTVAVSDFAMDEQRRITRLALDYEIVCSSGETVRTWMRRNTSVPLP